MYQEILIQTIQRKLEKQQSLIEAVAVALDISYDAAHRRISIKSKFSIEETVRLAKAFEISLDNLFLDTETVLVKKTREIQNFHDLTYYLENSLRSLAAYNADEQTSLYYSAKDIPLFYTIGNNVLSKFKLFVWLNLLGSKQDEISFESFRFQAPMLETSEGLKDFYDTVQVNEIWNDTTINSTLQQIMYFFQSGLLTVDNAFALCDNLKELIHTLEKKCEPSNEQYRLYYHDLLILNNNVLVSDEIKKSLFIPYTMLGYFITQDAETCTHAHNFYQYQLKNSKLLNTAGTRDKKIFFNKTYQKVDFYKNQIQSAMAYY